MRAISNLEQHLGVNPFTNEIEVDKKPEAVREVKVAIDEAVERAVKGFEKFITRDRSAAPLETIFEFDGPIPPLPKNNSFEFEALTPPQIEIAAQKILADDTMFSTEFKQKYAASIKHNLGDYLVELIKKSYNSEHNNFLINTNELIGFSSDITGILKGTAENKIQLSVNGYVHHGFGSYSSFCNYIINGSSGSRCARESNNCTYSFFDSGSLLGVNSEHCRYEITSNVQDSCGIRSTNSKYNIRGNAGYGLGEEASLCEFTVLGRVKSIGVNPTKCIFTLNQLNEQKDIYSTGCGYKTKNPETYKILIDKIFGDYNIIALLDTNGKITSKRIKR